MDGCCVVCRKPTGPLNPICGNSKCVRIAKPCKKCGTPKTGHSPHCVWCRMDRLNGSQITEHLGWRNRRERRHLRPPRKPGGGPPVPGLNWCAGCRDWLHPRWFLKWDDYKKGKDIPPRCRPCRSQASHDARIKKQFGILPDEYERLLRVQGGVCGICGGKPRAARLAVDHDHTTGDVRGLLCSRCNNELLGAAHDSVELLRRAIEYLEQPPAGAGEPVVENHILALA